MSEEGMNYNTLSMPLEETLRAGVAREAPELRSLLEQLLTRDATARLGGGPGGAAAVRAHAFFATVEWRLLQARRLPAPWVPDKNLVCMLPHLWLPPHNPWGPSHFETPANCPCELPVAHPNYTCPSTPHG